MPLPDTGKKISQLPPQASPTTSDKIPLVNSGVTDYVLISDLITLFFNNIPTSAATSTTLAQDTQFDYIKGGTGVWTADSAGVNRAASMSALTAYQNGQKLTVSAVSARVFTASKDTYIDLLNTSGVGTLVYTEVTNNAASPALAANSVRVGIVVTGATTIAAAASINQGQEDRILPIASSIAYSVTDSLGNLICPRDPDRHLLGYRQLTGDANPSAGNILGLNATVIVPTGRKVKVSCGARSMDTTSGASTALNIQIFEDGSQIAEGGTSVAGANYATPAGCERTKTPSAGSHTYLVALIPGSGTATLRANSNYPSWIKIELF